LLRRRRFDEGVGGFFGAVVVDVDALVCGGFGEAEGVGGGGGYLVGVRHAADAGELAEDADERLGQRGEAKGGEPETEIELIGHWVILFLCGFVRGTPPPPRFMQSLLLMWVRWGLARYRTLRGQFVRR